MTTQDTKTFPAQFLSDLSHYITSLGAVVREINTERTTEGYTITLRTSKLRVKDIASILHKYPYTVKAIHGTIWHCELHCEIRELTHPWEKDTNGIR